MTCQIDIDGKNLENRNAQVAPPFSSSWLVDEVAIEMNPAVFASKIDKSQYPIIQELVKKLCARDIDTGKHSKRLSGFAELTATKLGINVLDAQVVFWSGMLHDIGKTEIPDAVLHEPGPLSQAQWAIMRRHPQIGAEIILRSTNLPQVASLVLSHHEKWDGSGYPYGLKGEDIPLGARILSVTDSYCAMIDDRVYRPARSHLKALAELQRWTGIYYDPHVLRAFLSLFDDSKL